MELENRVAALLRERGVPLIPLRTLHRALAMAPGAGVGDIGSLQRRLSARRDLFFVLERGSPLLGAEDWPARDRAAYEDALRAAGWEGGPLIGAIPDWDTARGGDPGATTAARVSGVLAELASAPADEALRARLAEALPLAEATMRALAEAFRAKVEYAGEVR